jgi:hypothetical protein
VDAQRVNESFANTHASLHGIEAALSPARARSPVATAPAGTPGTSAMAVPGVRFSLIARIPASGPGQAGWHPHSGPQPRRAQPAHARRGRGGRHARGPGGHRGYGEPARDRRTRGEVHGPRQGRDACAGAGCVTAGTTAPGRPGAPWLGHERTRASGQADPRQLGNVHVTYKAPVSR